MAEAMLPILIGGAASACGNLSAAAQNAKRAEMQRAEAQRRAVYSNGRPTARPADITDMARLHALVAIYYETVAKRPQDDGALARYLLDAATLSGQCCFVIGEPAYGLICGVVARHPRTDELVATKTAWWVKHRIRGAYLALQRSFEKWAKQQGATRITMTAAAWAPKATKFLEIRGYKAVETVYEKEI